MCVLITYMCAYVHICVCVYKFESKLQISWPFITKYVFLHLLRIKTFTHNANITNTINKNLIMSSNIQFILSFCLLSPQLYFVGIFQKSRIQSMGVILMKLCENPHPRHCFTQWFWCSMILEWVITFSNFINLSTFVSWHSSSFTIYHLSPLSIITMDRGSIDCYSQ